MLLGNMFRKEQVQQMSKGRMFKRITFKRSAFEAIGGISFKINGQEPIKEEILTEIPKNHTLNKKGNK